MQEGDYVRLIDGRIGKIKAISSDYIIVELKYTDIYTEKKNIAKFNTFIVFIIEKGDYVNGGEVYFNENGYLLVGFPDEEEPHYITNDMIKTVITKQQMQQIEYEVDNDA